MLDCDVNKTKLLVVLREMFLTLEMLHNIKICKCHEDDMFIFSLSQIEPTAIVSKQLEMNVEVEEKEEGKNIIDLRP